MESNGPTMAFTYLTSGSRWLISVCCFRLLMICSGLKMLAVNFLELWELPYTTLRQLNFAQWNVEYHIKSQTLCFKYTKTSIFQLSIALCSLHFLIARRGFLGNRNESFSHSVCGIFKIIDSYQFGEHNKHFNWQLYPVLPEHRLHSFISRDIVNKGVTHWILEMDVCNNFHN